MPGWLFGRGKQRRRPRLVGCLLWILALVVLLIVLSLLFGGFRKGTRALGVPPSDVRGRGEVRSHGGCDYAWRARLSTA